MHVVFVEPCFPANQREFVRALPRSARRSPAIGERPKDSLDDELRRWLTHYEQVGSVVRRGRGAATRCASSRASERVDRLEATVEAHIMPAARVREALRHPGHVACAPRSCAATSRR